MGLLIATGAVAETLRIATFHSGLSRKGPGTLVRDLASGRDEQAEAAIAVIARARADVLLLLDVDWDLDGVALRTLVDRLSQDGLDYHHAIAPHPNAGQPSGFDLDGDGTDHEARDALGYGRFLGDGGLALLSNRPLGPPVDHGPLWADVSSDATALLPPGAEAVIPLATLGQWSVPMGGLTLIPMAAGTPVFDGPEDRNGLRNRDELALVSRLAAELPRPVVFGRANLDPADGEGVREAVQALLAHPALRDPLPRGGGGAARAIAAIPRSTPSPGRGRARCGSTTSCPPPSSRWSMPASSGPRRTTRSSRPSRRPGRGASSGSTWRFLDPSLGRR